MISLEDQVAFLNEILRKILSLDDKLLSMANEEKLDEIEQLIFEREMAVNLFSQIFIKLDFTYASTNQSQQAEWVKTRIIILDLVKLLIVGTEAISHNLIDTRDSISKIMSNISKNRRSIKSYNIASSKS